MMSAMARQTPLGTSQTPGAMRRCSRRSLTTCAGLFQAPAAAAHLAPTTGGRISWTVFSRRLAGAVRSEVQEVLDAGNTIIVRWRGKGRTLWDEPCENECSWPPS
jgi:hypothetical protein